MGKFIFSVVAFLLVYGPIGYGLYVHEYGFIIGAICGSVGLALSNATKVL